MDSADPKPTLSIALGKKVVFTTDDDSVVDAAIRAYATSLVDGDAARNGNFRRDSERIAALRRIQREAQ